MSTRIIQGRRFNTETATRVARWGNGHGMSDFHYVDEQLYHTKKGQWFLVGEGGALSSYAQSCGHNSTCGGEQWSLLTAEDAMAWLEEHHQTEALEEYFADKIQEG